MKTKYILHGGNAQHVNSENDLFFSEILKDTNDKLTILLVEFAGRDEKIQTNFKVDSSRFSRVKGDKHLSFILADQTNFLKQVDESDIVYFGGGTTIRLMEKLNNYSNLKNHLKGKIIAGESAGANCLSTVAYSKSGGGAISGLSLLAIKTIPHYVKGMEEHLKHEHNDLELVTLPEYKFKIIEVEEE